MVFGEIYNWKYIYNRVTYHLEVRMAMTVCSECQKDISDKAPVCPHCGAKKPKSYTWLYFVLGLPVAFLIFGAVQADKPEVKERRRAEDVIAECWKDQGRKSNGSGVAQFIAGACEKMEEDYLQKYGRRP